MTTATLITTPVTVMTIGEASRHSGDSQAWTRRLAEAGRLRVVGRTAGGITLLDPSSVEQRRLARLRQMEKR